MEKTTKKNEKLIKVLQILSALFMLSMVVTMLVLMKKFNINIDNAAEFATYIKGGTFTVGLIIIAFTVIKSFALVFPPAVIFAVSGLLIDNLWVAILINFIGVALSVILPYYLGRFTGKDMLTTLKKKYKAVNKLDAFTDENTFAVVFAFKVGGLMPSDLSSLIFGAMNVPFSTYFIASNLGLLVLNVCWSVIGAIGDLTNIWTYICMIPIGICLVGSLIFMKKASDKKKVRDEDFIKE